MKVEIDIEAADSIVLQSLIGSYEGMIDYLEKYKDPDHGWIAVFSTDEEEDIKQLKKMRDALALVINHWYGGKVDEATEVIAGECVVNLLRENEDGSADYQFNFPPEALQALTRLGILTAIQAGIEEAKHLKPEEETPDFTTTIKELADEAGFALWGGEKYKPTDAVVDWASEYDDALVKFYHLVRERVLKEVGE